MNIHKFSSALFHAAVVILTVHGAKAQHTIVTDRPDFTESGISVPKGAVQLEGGILWVDHGPNQTFSIPDALVRIGIRDGLEVRFGIPDYEDREFVSGIGDLSLGAKLELDGLLENWQVAAIATLVLPTGEQDISGDGVGLEVVLGGGTELNEDWTFGAQTSLGFSSDDGDTDLELGGTVAAGTSIADDLGTFFELAVVIPEHGGMELILHTGLTYLLGDSLQLDLQVGLGLNDSAPDALFGTGISMIL